MPILQLRRGTAAQWTTANPVLADGEPGLETDTGKRKTGNGSTAWTALAYDAGGSVADASTTVKGVAKLATPLTVVDASATDPPAS